MCSRPSSKVSLEDHRHLRVLAEGTDHFLKGELLQGLDILVMDFKAITMSIKDGNWDAAQYLEFAMVEDSATASSLEERELATRLNSHDHKVKALDEKCKSAR